jgi:hypothetical protein
MIAGTQFWLWRSVDDEGEVPHVAVRRPIAFMPPKPPALRQPVNDALPSGDRSRIVARHAGAKSTDAGMSG